MAHSWLSDKKGTLKYPLYNNVIDENKKVFVIGLPKSGNNWLYILLADCLDLNCIDPDFEKEKTGVGITHSPFKDNIKDRNDVAHACYIMRDIRDIIVSYFKYSQTADYHKNMDPSCIYDNIEDFYYEYFLSQKIDRYYWYSHAEYFIGRGIPMIKYENLYDNTYNELSKLFKRWGLQVEEEKIRQAISNNTIDKLKLEGKKTYREIPTSHFRKGGYNNYKDEMPEKASDNCCPKEV